MSVQIESWRPVVGYGRSCLACSYERSFARKHNLEFSAERADAQLVRILTEHQEIAA